MMNWSLLFSDFVTENGKKHRHATVVLVLLIDIVLNTIIGLTPYVDNFSRKLLSRAIFDFTIFIYSFSFLIIPSIAIDNRLGWNGVWPIVWNEYDATVVGRFLWSD
jgi:uncharacterized membrane protein